MRSRLARGSLRSILISGAARPRSALTAFVLGAAVWAAAPAALAQSTGGSFGSSDFGGGGGGGSSSSGSSDWGSSGGSSSPSQPATPPSAATFDPPSAELGARWPTAAEAPDDERALRQGGSDLFLQACCAALPFTLFGLFGLSWFFGSTGEERRTRRDRRTRPYEVRRVSIAFDWTVRARLQAALTSLAQDPGVASDRRRTAAAVAEQLRAALGGARFATFQSFHVDKRECQERFGAMGIELRARFERETAGQRANSTAPALEARAHEGEGLVAVSVVVATDAWLAPLPKTMDRAALGAALDSLARILARTVFGLEVVWSPAEELDRMSSYELEGVYPELQALDDVPRLGRVACAYCAAPYPAELTQCPGCGAPRADVVQ